MASCMTKEDVLRFARDAELNAHDSEWLSVRFERFAALIEEHLKEQGYRQCAKGQRTTQFCGMLEQAVQAEREECAKVAEEATASWTQHIYNDACMHIAAAIRSRT